MLPHHHIFKFLHNRELDELYASFAIRAFAVSMISIFIPVYLINLGSSIRNVILYFLLAHLTSAICCIPAAKLTARFGFKHVMNISLPFLIIGLLMLNTLPQYNWPLWIIGIIMGINMGMYWTGFHIDFSTVSDQKNRAAEVGVVRLIMSGFRAIGPVIGGVLIAFTGFKLLFIIVCILIIASGIPLLLSKDRHASFDFTIKDVAKRFIRPDLIPYVARGVERGIYASIWPIIVFFSIAKSYTTLGGITTATLVLSLFFTFIISKAADKRRMLVYRLGCLLNAAVWFIRVTLKTNLQVFFTDSLYGVSKTMYMIPFDANDYDKAANGKIVRHIIFREISIAIGYVLIFGLLWILNGIDYVLYIAAIASFALLFLKK
jgi:MFS family permease